MEAEAGGEGKRKFSGPAQACYTLTSWQLARDVTGSRHPAEEPPRTRSSAPVSDPTCFREEHVALSSLSLSIPAASSFSPLYPFSVKCSILLR